MMIKSLLSVNNDLLAALIVATAFVLGMVVSYL